VETKLIKEKGMKKILSFVVVALVGMSLVSGVYAAETSTTANAVQVSELLKAIPNANQGGMWIPGTQEVEYISTWPFLTYQRVSLEGGYLTAGGLLGVLSYDVGGLKDLGVNTPILNLIELNIGVGGGVKYVGDKNVWVGGVTGTLIKLHF